MRRAICLLLIVCAAVFMCATTACAESDNAAAGGLIEMEIGRITQIYSDTQIDLDMDGDQETIEFEILRDAEGYDTGYRLSVGEASVEGEGWFMNEDIYVLRLNEDDALLLVSDFGPSDDYETHFYLYANDALIPVGSILSLPESMEVNDGIITAPIRGYLLYTWFHDADFGLADYWGEEGKTKACIYQIPRHLYPMGLMAKLKVDLPLAVSPTNPEIACMLESGSDVILCATDDVEWVYIQSAIGGAAGWMRVGGEYGMECIVGDEMMFSWDVFDGLLFAD